MTREGQEKNAGTAFRRRRDFERAVQSAAAAWFRAHGLAVDPQRPYCLARYDDWAQNIIEPAVATYVREERRRQEERSPFPLHK